MPSERPKRAPASEFQKKFAAQFGEINLDPVLVAMLNEIAKRLAESRVYPPGIVFEVGKAIADVVSEVQTIPESLLGKRAVEQDEG